MSEAEISDLLYEGETPGDELRMTDTRLVMTSHRLLVVREQGTPRVRAVDRPNLGAVRTRTESARGYLLSTAQWTGVGLFLLAAWRFVPLGEFGSPIEAPPGIGFEGLFAAVNALLSLLALLDEAFLITSVLALGWAVVRLGRYLYGRMRVLEVTVAGEDPIRLPAPDDEEMVDQLRTLIRSATAAGSE